MTTQQDLTDHDMLIRIDTTVLSMNAKLSSVCKRIGDGEEARSKLNTRVTRLEERMSLWAGLQAIWSTGVAAIAAWIGARK